MSAEISLAIHGGAGDIPAREAAADRPFHAALLEIVGSTRERLLAGTSALEAVTHAVARLEDCELFNAGRGAVLTSSGDVELDASLMDGHDGRAAAVGAVRHVRNPIRLCERLLEDGRHVMLVGAGADERAREFGLERVENEELIVPSRRAQWQHVAPQGGYALDHDEAGGTVGAVARDVHGHMAAATSTGGMSNQWPGRLGDSAVIGAGTWADDRSCAISATGHGECFIRTGFARAVAARLELAGMGLDVALTAEFARLQRIGGRGGCIAIDSAGRIAMPFNSTGMYRAWATAASPPQAAIR